MPVADIFIIVAAELRGGVVSTVNALPLYHLFHREVILWRCGCIEDGILRRTETQPLQ